MSIRLDTVLSFIKDGIGCADIGTDHAQIPIALAQMGYQGHIVASDIHIGPLDSAKRFAREANCEERINFCLADGLQGIDPKSIDTIVIAGMGGDTICGILDRAEWCMSPEYSFILQPMTKSEVLRFWLINNGFSIESDVLVKEFGKIYSVLYVHYTGKNTILSDGELFTGSFELIRNNLLFEEWINLISERILRIYTGLKMCGAEDYCVRFYENILDEIVKMREC